ncbi:YybH family protein [Devosia nitrariae]|uniref:DUF4440 domain-containing protein n=1 Tax=Devosia nitrariae TaxID=2071872 RepID=A0ABQ5W185_9HYPH|nr:DUF4440 domain-containing protein [Devosia nitrariae]GLQ53440.1 hypothetical protein GCM10010862_06980 [Devosia nitrariae]
MYSATIGLGLFALACTCTVIPTSAQDREIHSHALILATIETMADALSRADVEGVLATYEEGAVVMGRPEEPVSGRTDLSAFFADLAAIAPQFRFLDEQVVEAGDIALHLAPWTMEGTAPDGTPLTDRGLSIAVLRRQSDGNWRMIIDQPYGDWMLATPR